jgi:hypothetical protein
MGDWIPIFKTGTHTDSRGNIKDWTEWDLDNIVEKFDPKTSAPIVIGHPQHNTPAFGWVEGLKRVGQILYYKPMQVVEEFREMVNKGLFKKRSISLNPDLTLRHIGYLGAMSPAIKGLPDHTFMEEDMSIIISTDFSEKDEVRKWKSNMQGKQEENELIEKLADLTKNEMLADSSLTISNAMTRVIKKTPAIQALMNRMKGRMIEEAVKKMDIGEFLTDLINQKMEGNKDMSFSEAFNEVQIENPEFARKHFEEIHGYRL